MGIAIKQWIDKVFMIEELEDMIKDSMLKKY
jgi:hypothetical protein